MNDIFIEICSIIYEPSNNVYVIKVQYIFENKIRHDSINITPSYLADENIFDHKNLKEIFILRNIKKVTG